MISAICVSLLYLFLLLRLYSEKSPEITGQRIVHFIQEDESERRDSVCRLPNLNPWDPQILPFLDFNRNISVHCTITHAEYTFLHKGQLRMLDNSYCFHNCQKIKSLKSRNSIDTSMIKTSSCQYRCLYAVGEKVYRSGEWIKMEKGKLYHENCDFIETHCTSSNKTTFRYIHSQVKFARQKLQIVKPSGKQFQVEDELNPSVFIVVLDSTSSSSAKRTLLETERVFRQFYDSTTFHYHNKVGANSRSNAFAMFSGTRIVELNAKEFPTIFAPELNDSCNSGLNKNKTIAYDFIRKGYASLIMEDWIGAFTWPNCKGYGDIPTDHYGAPLILRSTGYVSHEEQQEFRTYFYEGECQERYHKVLEYAHKFLKTYRGISKFAVLWLSKVTHDSPDGLYRMDKHLANFFQDHVKELAGSFIFLTADHGLLFGKIRQTRSGAIESSNPLLTMATPKFLRTNKEIVANLRKNAARHTSHYDFFATLYDIAHVARRSRFQRWNEHDFRTQVKNSNISILEMTSKLLQETFERKRQLRIVVIAAPSNGRYEAVLIDEGHNYTLVNTVTRVDSYGHQGYCAMAEDVRPLCYCKRQF